MIVSDSLTSAIKSKHKAGASLACLVIDVQTKTDAFDGELAVLQTCDKLGIHVWFFQPAKYNDPPNLTKLIGKPGEKFSGTAWAIERNKHKVPVPDSHQSSADPLYDAVHESRRHEVCKKYNNAFKDTSLVQSLKFFCPSSVGKAASKFPSPGSHVPVVLTRPEYLIVIGQDLCSCIRCTIVHSRVGEDDGGPGAVDLGYRVMTGRSVVLGEHRGGSEAILQLPTVEWYTRL